VPRLLAQLDLCNPAAVGAATGATLFVSFELQVVGAVAHFGPAQTFLVLADRPMWSRGGRPNRGRRQCYNSAQYLVLVVRNVNLLDLGIVGIMYHSESLALQVADACHSGRIVPDLLLAAQSGFWGARDAGAQSAG
jgi:hypothetical protein